MAGFFDTAGQPNLPWFLNGGVHCRIEEVPSFRNAFHQTEINTVSYSSKLKLFSSPAAAYSRATHWKPEVILQRVMDSAVAVQLKLKVAAIANTPFRLVKRISAPRDGRIGGAIEVPEDESFIALSYCWHNSSMDSAGPWPQECVDEQIFGFRYPDIYDTVRGSLRREIKPK